jgi:hypothetical protein
MMSMHQLLHLGNHFITSRLGGSPVARLIFSDSCPLFEPVVSVIHGRFLQGIIAVNGVQGL